MSLFNRLSKSTRGEMHLTSESLLLVVSEPVLEKRGTAILSASCLFFESDGHILEWGRAEGVEAESCDGSC